MSMPFLSFILIQFSLFKTNQYAQIFIIIFIFWVFWNVFPSFIFLSKSCLLFSSHMCGIKNKRSIFFFKCTKQYFVFFSSFLFISHQTDELYFWNLSLCLGCSTVYSMSFAQSYLTDQKCVTHWHQYNKSFWRRFIFFCLRFRIDSTKLTISSGLNGMGIYKKRKTQKKI